MPTVPPTFVSFDRDDVLPPPCALADPIDIMGSPTPDPDYDDRVLVSVVTGDGIGAVTSSLAHVDMVAESHDVLKPRLGLANLSLHSPSSIVGTPFDVEPRFEYPFPPSSGSSDSDSMPRHASLHLSPTFSPLSFGPSSLPLSRGEVRTVSPVHLKLQARDPPVPPGLAKKKRNTMELPKPTHTRKRSHSAAPTGSDPVPNSSAEPWALDAKKPRSEAGEDDSASSTFRGRAFSDSGDR